jgi:hypothetical protein
MKDIQYLAKLITQLADSPIDSPCDVYEEIIKIGGHWYTIGRPEGKHYIDALNLDNNGYLLKKSIKAYIAQRQNYLKNTKEKLLNLDYKFYLDDRYSFFMVLVQHCGDSATFVLPEIRDMLHNEDIEIKDSGLFMLKEAGLEAIQLLPDMFDIMQKRGLDGVPYKIGEILARLSRLFPEVLERLKLNLSSDRENLLQATLYTCYLMDRQADFFYEDLMRIAKSKTDELKSLAILALGSTGNKNEDLGEFLLKNTTSSEWYIRGNAITSLGKLQLFPERAIPIIINALDDDEGYDWTVRESALKALMNYADFAAKYKTSLVPILKSLRKRIKDEQENGWIATIQDINTILNMLKKL